jgi:hypothetical protein
MAFGVLYDFTGNKPTTRVTPASTMIQQPWFLEAVNNSEPIDLYLIVGQNPVRTRPNARSTLHTVYKAIREMKPEVPIQAFGGHTHLRDFAIYDDKATALESGKRIWYAQS